MDAACGVSCRIPYVHYIPYSVPIALCSGTLFPTKHCWSGLVPATGLMKIQVVRLRGLLEDCEMLIMVIIFLGSEWERSSTRELELLYR